MAYTTSFLVASPAPSYPALGSSPSVLPARLYLPRSRPRTTARSASLPRAAAPHHEQPPPAHGDDLQAPLLDRRELMAASVAGLSCLPLSARASPMAPPDLSTCIPATVASTGKPTISVQCCLPVSSTPAVGYKPAPPNKLRVRRPAHLVDAAYIEKYNRAYERMKALPDNDPRSFKQQANVHCAFCNGAYPLASNSSSELQIHFSWTFLPWHRWYLYFHEKILGSLIGDPTFALPFWNWDDQKYGGNVMPALFLQSTKYPALYNSKRDQSHLPPSLALLSLSDLSASLTNDQIIADNLGVMYKSVTQATTPGTFMGTAPLYEDLTNSSAQGTLEGAPHTAIHVWTGNPDETYREDMGNFYSAGRDPIFYCHHANVDRIWTVWNGIGGRRSDHTDSDFLNSEFIFYDENKKLVKVLVKDCLDSGRQLGIVYEPVVKGDAEWLGLDPKPAGTKGVVPAAVKDLTEIGAAAKGKAAKEVTETLSALVARPTTTAAEYAKAKGLKEEEVEEVLVLQDVKVPMDAVSQVAVFINLPDADAKTPLNVAEYVGSLGNVPHLGMDMAKRKLSARFALTDNIKRLGLEKESKLAVTLVAKVVEANASPIAVGGFLIEYE